jgi:predicted nuclease of predicted toxin-antitoxin system
MVYLANENVPNPSIVDLREKGYTIISVRESHPGITDYEVIRLAIDQNHVIITLDSDYGSLIFKENLKNPPAVICFRDKGSNPYFVSEMLQEAINSGVDFEKKFTVIESRAIRQKTY